MKLITTDEQLRSHLPNVIALVKGETPFIERLVLFLDLLAYFRLDLQHHLRLYRQQQYQDIVLAARCCRRSSPRYSLARHCAYAQWFCGGEHLKPRSGIEAACR